MTERAYFDWNATAPLRPAAREAMLKALESHGNPSSVHAEGRQARAAIETARGQVAQLIGTKAKNVTFTSGGSEANALALTPHLQSAGRKTQRDQLLVSAVEHPSVLAGGRFEPSKISTVMVVEAGILDLEDLRRTLGRTSSALVSVMLANNETGVIQPIRQIADIVREAGGLLHVDAVQALGRIAVNFDELGADLMTVSSHKIGGPQGAGALIKREEIHIAQPLIAGGGQERGLRAGTENVAAIAGFGAACAELKTSLLPEIRRLSASQSAIERRLRELSGDLLIFGGNAPRLPNTTLATAPGLKAETAIIAFDLAGISVSSGSACSSGKVSASHVLAAMGVAPELAKGAIRISTGYATSEADIEKLMAAWMKVVPSLTKGQASKTGIAA